MRTRTRNLKRLLSLALCLCMVTGLLPVTALAAAGTWADPHTATIDHIVNNTTGDEQASSVSASDDFKLSVRGITNPATAKILSVYFVTTVGGDFENYNEPTSVFTLENDDAVNIRFANGLKTGYGSSDFLPAGTYHVLICDDQNYPPETWYNAGQITVTAATGAPASNPTIITGSLPVGYTGEEYHFQMEADPGTDGNTLTWSATGLPDGLSISEEGLITGKPTAAGTAYAYITVTEKDGSDATVGTASKDYQIVISEKANITDASLNFPENSPADMGAVWTLTLTSGTSGNITLPVGTRLIVSSTATDGEMPTVYTARLNDSSSVSATMTDGSWSLDLGGKILKSGANSIALPNVNVGEDALNYSIQMVDSSGAAVSNAFTGTTRTPTQVQYTLNLSETTASVQAGGRLTKSVTLTLTAKNENGDILDTVNGSVTVEAALTGGGADKAIKVNGRATYQAMDGDKPLTSATFPVSLVGGYRQAESEHLPPCGKLCPD